MSIPGYAGYILYVDLTSRRTWKEPLDPEWARTFFGGQGINFRLIYDQVPPLVDPFSPENALVFGSGPFSGTIVPGSSELVISTKLPLTGGFGANSGGGAFNLMLKSSGYDHLVITGASERPVYLTITDDEVAVRDASDLWGVDSFDTVDELRKRHEPCSIVPIGQAGENLVMISVSQIDKGGTVGFCGMPAVMGSKKLKAVVACKGTKRLEVADPERLLRLVDHMMQRVIDYKLRPLLLEGGTSSMTVDWLGEMDRATRNWTEVLPRPANALTVAYQGGFGLKEIDEVHKKLRKTLACPSCPVGDKELCFVKEGEYAPMRSYMTDFMGQGGYGGKTALDDHNRAVKLVDTDNRYGICHMNFHNTLGLMVYLYEEGIITKEDTGGIELKEDFQTVLELARMTALREGFGDIMADGALKGARRLGREAEKHVVHIKGCAPYFDARLATLDSMSFGQMTHQARTHYAPAGVGMYAPERPIEQFLMHANRIGIPQEAQKRIFSADSFNVGRLTKHTEDWYCLFQCLGQCHRLYIHRFHSMQGFMDFYTAITGNETNAAEFLKAGERSWNLQKVLNYRAGFSRKDDQAPEAWFTPLKGKDREYPLMDYYRRKVLSREDVEQTLDDYYDERGWDKKTSAPTPQKLKELGLGEFAV